MQQTLTAEALARMNAARLGPSIHDPGTIQLPLGAIRLAGRPFLPPGIDDRVVVVRDDEPTSVIAYFLSTREYQVFLDDAVALILYGAGRPLQHNAAGNRSLEDLTSLNKASSSVRHPPRKSIVLL